MNDPDCGFYWLLFLHHIRLKLSLQKNVSKISALNGCVEKATWAGLFFSTFIAVTARGIDWTARVGQVIRGVGNAYLMIRMMLMMTMAMTMILMTVMITMLMTMMTGQP